MCAFCEIIDFVKLVQVFRALVLLSLSGVVISASKVSSSMTF